MHLFCESWKDSFLAAMTGLIPVAVSRLEVGSYFTFCRTEASTCEVNYYLENFVFSAIIKIPLPSKSYCGDLSNQELSEGRDCVIHFCISGALHHVRHIINAQEMFVELMNG